MRPSPRDEHGFSMVIVLCVMLVGAMLVTASINLTTGDQPQLRKSLARFRASENRDREGSA